MALTDSDLSDLLAALKAGEVTDTVRTSLEWILQELIEAEASSVIGARPYERTDSRTTQRNGHRPRLLSTAAGDVGLKIPKLRTGGFFPSLLERRRRIDRALFAVVMEAYVHGVSTRKVDDLVQALGVGSGISKSEVSRICAELDRDLEAFRNRPLGHVEFPCSPTPPTSKAASTAGSCPGPWSWPPGSPPPATVKCWVWPSATVRTGPFGPPSCKASSPGPLGVQLVISDHHLGLKAAIAGVFIGAGWQRAGSTS